MHKYVNIPGVKYSDSPPAEPLKKPVKRRYKKNRSDKNRRISRIAPDVRARLLAASPIIRNHRETGLRVWANRGGKKKETNKL